MSVSHYLNCDDENCERYHCVERRDKDRKLNAAKDDVERLEFLAKNSYTVLTARKLFWVSDFQADKIFKSAKDFRGAIDNAMKDHP